MLEERRPVPVRTILATIGLVLATVLVLYLVHLLARIELLLIIAVFFAVVLTPAVNAVQRRLHVPRGLAASIVFLLGLGLITAMLYVIIRPLVDQTVHFADRFPEYVREARAGRGPAGGLVKRLRLDERLGSAGADAQGATEPESRLRRALSDFGNRGVGVIKGIFAGVAALVTILVLAFLIILYGPGLMEGALGMLSPPQRARIQPVAVDCARALTGYMAGNLLISIVAGTVTFIALWIFGVPFRGVLALWVAFADLIPLVGATLGAVPTILVAFIHSTTAGIGMLIVYVVYQQFENHVLQVVIMSKTVQINQLAVLISVLIGVELAGITGALLAIPAAGVIQVITRDIYDHRRGVFKQEPTIGADEIPISEVEEGGHGIGPGESPALARGEVPNGGGPRT